MVISSQLLSTRVIGHSKAFDPATHPALVGLGLLSLGQLLSTRFMGPSKAFDPATHPTLVGLGLLSLGQLLSI
jgi:hypothetical protein